MGYLDATLMQVFTRVRGRRGRITQRCHNSPRWETGASECEWRHTPEAPGRFWEILKKSVQRLDTGRDDWLSLARGGLEQVSHEMGGGRWKGRNRKNVYLSPYVEKPLNSKVIKSFVPELRSRKCFSCFGIPMFYVIYTRNIICPFHT